MPPKPWRERRGDEVYRLCRDSPVPDYTQRRLQALVDDVVGEKGNLDRVLHERKQEILELNRMLDSQRHDPSLEDLYRAGSKLITRQADEIKELKMGRKADAELVAMQREEIEGKKVAPKGPSVGSSAIINKQAEQIRNLQIALEETRIAKPEVHFPGSGMAEKQASAALNLVRNLQRDVAERDRTIRAHAAEMASTAAANKQSREELEVKVKHWQKVAEHSQQLIQQLNAENRELVRHVNVW